MIFKNTSSSYGLISKSLHWIIALTIFAMFAVGIWMVDLTYYDIWYKDAPFYHKSVGILLASLMLFRWLWRLREISPDAIKGHTGFEKKAAKLTHRLLYLLVMFIVISGYLISTADGRAIEVFGWFEVPALGALINNQEDIAGEFHQWLAYALIGLVSLHAGAAIKHHFIDKDDTLKRML